MFRLTPMFLAFEVKADVHEYAVTFPESLSASTIVSLIHLRMLSLDTSLNDDNFVIKSPGSEDFGNWTWRYLSNVANGHRLGHSGYARKGSGFGSS